MKKDIKKYLLPPTKHIQCFWDFSIHFFSNGPNFKISIKGPLPYQFFYLIQEIWLPPNENIMDFSEGNMPPPKTNKKTKDQLLDDYSEWMRIGNQFFLILAWAIPFYYIITGIFPQAASQAEVLILEAWGPVWIGFLGVINIFFSKA